MAAKRLLHVFATCLVLFIARSFEGSLVAEAGELPPPAQAPEHLPFTHMCIYLIQTKTGAETLNYILGLPTAQVDVLIGYYGSDLADPRLKDPAMFHTMETRGSTWTVGRNMMLQRALQLERDLQRRYNFFVFMDGDMWLQIQPSSTFSTILAVSGQPREAQATDVIEQTLGACERTDQQGVSETAQAARRAFTYFECALQKYQAPLAAAGVHMQDVQQNSKQHLEGEATVLNWVDAAVNGFHRDALPILLPYSNRFDKPTWFLSQYILLMRGKCVLEKIIQLNWVKLHLNGTNMHSKYPKVSRAYLRKHHLSSIQELAQGYESVFLPDELRYKPGSDSTMIYNLATTRNHVAWGPPHVVPIHWKRAVPASCYVKTSMNAEHAGFKTWQVAASQ